MAQDTSFRSDALTQRLTQQNMGITADAYNRAGAGLASGAANFFNQMRAAEAHEQQMQMGSIKAQSAELENELFARKLAAYDAEIDLKTKRETLRSLTLQNDNSEYLAAKQRGADEPDPKEGPNLGFRPQYGEWVAPDGRVVKDPEAIKRIEADAARAAGRAQGQRARREQDVKLGYTEQLTRESAGRVDRYKNTPLGPTARKPSRKEIENLYIDEVNQEAVAAAIATPLPGDRDVSETYKEFRKAFDDVSDGDVRARKALSFLVGQYLSGSAQRRQQLASGQLTMGRIIYDILAVLGDNPGWKEALSPEYIPLKGVN